MISDTQLFVMLGLFVVIDLVILTVWELVDPLYIEMKFTGRNVSETLLGTSLALKNFDLMQTWLLISIN